MKYRIERSFSNANLGWTYQNFDDLFKNLIYEMRDRLGHLFTGDGYRNLIFVMNLPLYERFIIECKKSGHDSDMYRGIRIIQDPTLYIGDTQFPHGIVRLVYEEPETKPISYNDLIKEYCIHDVEATHELYYSSARNYGRGHGFQRIPHIDHVVFNGPATIVFWKDGTKTVVKHDGKGRKDKRLAVLYAFIRKIYGEGRPYHNILNEIEEAIK